MQPGAPLDNTVVEDREFTQNQPAPPRGGGTDPSAPEIEPPKTEISTKRPEIGFPGVHR